MMAPRARNNSKRSSFAHLYWYFWEISPFGKGVYFDGKFRGETKSFHERGMSSWNTVEGNVMIFFLRGSCTMNGGKEMLCTTGVKERSGSRERAQSCWPKFVWSKMGEKLKWWWTSRCRRSYRIVGRKRLEVRLDTVTRFSFRAHTFQKSDRVITSVAKSHRPPPFRFF